MAEPKVYYGAPRVGTDMVREANLWTVDTPDALVFVVIRALDAVRPSIFDAMSDEEYERFERYSVDAVRRIIAGERVSVLGYFVE